MAQDVESVLGGRRPLPGFRSLGERRDDAVLGLLARLGSRWPWSVRAEAPGDLAAADLVVNATPLGMRPRDPLPFDPAAVRADAVVADIVP